MCVATTVLLCPNSVFNLSYAVLYPSAPGFKLANLLLTLGATSSKRYPYFSSSDNGLSCICDVNMFWNLIQSTGVPLKGVILSSGSFALAAFAAFSILIFFSAISNSALIFSSQSSLLTIPGFNNENETKNYKITGLTILVLFALFVLKNLLLSQYSSVSYYNFTCLSYEY